MRDSDQQVAESQLNPKVIIVTAILKSLPTIESLSALIAKAKQVGIDTGDLAIRGIPGGVYSEDVERFVGQLDLLGYATKSSPLLLTSKGLELCREIVLEAAERHPEELQRLATALDFDLSSIEKGLGDKVSLAQTCVAASAR